MVINDWNTRIKRWVIQIQINIEGNYKYLGVFLTTVCQIPVDNREEFWENSGFEVGVFVQIHLHYEILHRVMYSSYILLLTDIIYWISCEWNESLVHLF